MAVATFILAVATRKLASTAERDFRAVRMPNATVYWRIQFGATTGDGMTRESFRLVGKLESLNNVALRLDGIDATAVLTRARRYRTTAPVSTAIHSRNEPEFSVCVDVDPYLDRGALAIFLVRARLRIASTNGAGTETWTARIEVTHADPAERYRFAIVDRPGDRLYRDRDQSYRQRVQARFQDWKHEMGFSP